MRGEAVAQGVGRRALGKAQCAAQALHLAPDDAVREPATAHPPEQRGRARKIVGAEPDIVGHRLPYRRDEGHGARLVALARDVERLAEREVGPLEREGLAYAQARAVEQREHGRVAGLHPRGVVARLREQRARTVDGERLGQRRGTLGAAQEGDGGVGNVVAAFEVAEEAAQRAELPVQGGGAHAVAAAGGEEGAEIGQPDAGEGRGGRAGPGMGLEEVEELGQVATVGLDGALPQPAFSGEVGQVPVEGVAGSAHEASLEGRR